MQLGRYSVSTLRPPPIHSITFSEDGRFFALAGEEVYEVWKSWPLALVKRRVLPGTLTLALLLPRSPLLVLQGGGANPLYPPNKAVVYNDKLGVAVAEVEFGERIRGIKARKGLLCVALSRKVIAFDYEGFWLRKFGEWETAENETGLMALSTSAGSTLLALPGRQPGHVQLISLPLCPPVPAPSNPSTTAFRSPIILAHTHPLSTLSCTPNGSHIITTSERGTLLRIWDTTKGRLERELRRGVDRAEMWGCEFENDGKGRVVAWSDKGTVHVWKDEDGARSKTEGTRSSTPTPSSTPSLTHILSRNLPLPKYFSSSPSIAQYHLPRKNPHAISSALGKAGVNVPSISMNKEDIDNEESELFVVAWIDVELTSDTQISQQQPKVVERRSSAIYDSPGSTPMMGGREERRSFGSGSDNTSRTVTPAPGTSSTHGRRNSYTRTVSSNFVNKSLIQDQPSSISSKQKVTTLSSKHTSLPPSIPKVEKQLIVITYSGDWYRLRIPDDASLSIGTSGGEVEGEEAKKGGSKCELVEYRRLGVGGGGW
ncbi:hypothetical protein L486_01511 [Kwoniella mangroviensis CBS 10435]|uniref:Uncharacterized protein n=1 Tax=Kwoniella mangroviensis CBS 10435 TaxID=1331196 RepID=A0A1B9J283_9TREE|nr:hypothetical protein L486_01511 [Kwoniella mangroviensis CBS 10435]